MIATAPAPRYIDPHIHMQARTTDDYEAMAACGIVAVIEPAFWMGQPRTSVGTYVDYLSALVGWERFRAAQFGIDHACSVGLNSKEANNEALAEAVMEVLPRFLLKEGVVGVGEIGYDEQSPLEERYFSAQLDLARTFETLVQIDTPHRDKQRGTVRSMDLCREHGLEPGRVIIDHNTEETAQAVLDRGFWAGFTIYPETKMSSERMVEIVRRYGCERIIVDFSADWGVSDPLAVPKTARLMAERGIPTEAIHATCYANALTAYGQSGQFNEADWLAPAEIDPSQRFLGNTILRGQDPATRKGAIAQLGR